MSEAHPLDPAATIPDVYASFREYGEASAATRKRFRFDRDVPYGVHPMERLDFISAGENAALAVFIHGGYWRRLDKGDFSFIAEGLLPHGISLASINYGLTPETPLAQIVEQCRRGVAWLVDNAERLRVDCDRISVFGHSAGAHLAAMTAVEIPVHSVVSVSGLHDLLPVQQSFANEWLRLDEQQARSLSSITYAPARQCPVFATVGERESTAFKEQSQAFVKAWAAFGCSAEYRESPGDNHFSICLRMRDPDDSLTKTIATLSS